MTTTKLRKVNEEDSRTRLSSYIEDLSTTINEIRTRIFFLHHDPSSARSTCSCTGSWTTSS
ncbi:MAG TPA: hypothetical protein VLJ88_10770 [Propionibacteriaceae bacterium]|nr:hypothetical protein [Propionibacteriaceae bacterium]